MAKRNDEWLQAIATRASTTVPAVEGVLSSHRIQPSPVLAQPRRLVLQSLDFSGVKDGVADSGPFSFSWADLTHGLWAMLSEKNLRGKSSIIEVVRWMLRGRPTNNLQDDIRRWIHDVALTFSIDSEQYRIVAQTKGNPIGSLNHVRRPSDKDESSLVVLAQFATDNEFEDVMADFFMRKLSMESISTWRQGTDDQGQTVSHSWVAFSGAMFIGTNYEVLLGDMPVASGLNARLIQMYLGIPWVSTLASAKSAHQLVEQAVQASARRTAQGQAVAQTRIATIRKELETKRTELAQIPSDHGIRETIQSSTAELQKLRRDEREKSARAERSAAALVKVSALLQDDRRDLQAHLDAMSATAVFRRLEPKCCPRCDHTISKAKKDLESATNACSVCGENVSSSEDAEAIKASIKDRIKNSEVAVDQARLAKSQDQDGLEVVQGRIATLQQAIETASNQLNAAVKRQEVATAVAVLEGRLQEASFVPTDHTDDRTSELNILTALVTETEARVKATRDGLLEDVSKRLVEYANAFGMKNLTAASLKGNAVLSLVKGGVQTSYSKVTEGEKLRLKVAAVLAMVEIGEKRGVGRHPGLLMIDSPAAQEVSAEDVEHLVAGLQEVSTNLPYFQVFVAGLFSKAITDHIPKENRKEARGETFLW